MLQKNVVLPTLRGGLGVTPVVMAVLQGKGEMALFLYPKTYEIFGDWDWNMLFFISINNEIYDLALQMLRERPKLALAQDGDDGTALDSLARKLSSCVSKRSANKRQSMKSSLEQNLIIELWSTYPDLMSEKDSQIRSIIHIAVLNRHASIFNLIHETGPVKDSIVSYVDSVDKCNLLHFAAKLAPQHRLDLFSGVAFQMMSELLWFEEVKKMVEPSFTEMRNSGGLTPSELFTREHKELLKVAESWMKGTANSCMAVSILIATGVFCAAFTITGANNNNTGDPNDLKTLPFRIFSIADVSALVSSATSILIFLSIIISSRYAEEDFLRSLPLKLISGLIALFISIISMMVTFSSAFFVTYFHGQKWVPYFISGLAFVPIPLFLFLQFPLWLDILYTKYFCRSLFRPNKNVLY